jgi:hypothetical protein
VAKVKGLGRRAAAGVEVERLLGLGRIQDLVERPIDTNDFNFLK